MPEEQQASAPGARAGDVTAVDGDNRLFISYSRRDEPIVRALYDGLLARGIGVWVDWKDIPPSAEWWTTSTPRFTRKPNRLSTRATFAWF